MFLAGVLPGILLTTLFVIAIYIVVWLKPEKAPQSIAPSSFKEKLSSLGRAVWIIGIVLMTIGGIGATLAFLVTIMWGALTGFTGITFTLAE
ncbi:MAG: TRAP-type C4-dicarboxylate transport system permease large subunit [Porticoccaceae bacterium]